MLKKQWKGKLKLMIISDENAVRHHQSNVEKLSFSGSQQEYMLACSNQIRVAHTREIMSHCPRVNTQVGLLIAKGFPTSSS